MNEKPIAVFKYGGNAMLNEQLKTEIVQNLGRLKAQGLKIVVVHGGGPFIKRLLSTSKVKSEFYEGHRVTTPEALKYVEMALKGEVNGNLVRLFNKYGNTAVGLSGKDGKIVLAEKRYHNSGGEKKDLGRVGDVKKVNPELLHLLLDNDIIPVLTCLASDADGLDYNINADMFAGHIAGALKAQQFVVMTDVDGLMTDISKPESLLSRVDGKRIQELKTEGIIKSGMIPKIEACTTALSTGAKTARIINGTKPNEINKIIENINFGTVIEK